MEETPLLSCQNLVLGYGGHVVASGISFAVHPGDSVCVIGENGTGKSTLLRTVLGLQPALSGKILFAPEMRPGSIGYLPQQFPVEGDFPATALEVVRSGFQASHGLRPFFRADERRAANAALARFGAEALAYHPYRELSGGQRQRVLLARALCAGRRLLALDEPVTGLDPEAAAELYNALAELRREGRGVLVVTHDLPVGLANATHVLELGTRPFFGTKAAWNERKEAPHD